MATANSMVIAATVGKHSNRIDHPRDHGSPAGRSLGLCRCHRAGSRAAWSLLMRRAKLWGPGPGRSLPHISQLTGDKDVMEPPHHGNRSGIGVVPRLPRHALDRAVRSVGSVCPVSLQPITVGTGGAGQVDSAVIDWSNAVFQVELDSPPANCTHKSGPHADERLDHLV